MSRFAPVSPARRPTTPAATSSPRLPFAGRIVYLFTGEQRATPRQHMADGFRALGAADVVCYEVPKSSRGQEGPGVFPADALVVVDTRFMSHRFTVGVRARVKASGCWSYETRGGASFATTIASVRAEQARKRRTAA